jgi:hypothetical protein
MHREPVLVYFASLIMWVELLHARSSSGMKSVLVYLVFIVCKVSRATLCTVQYSGVRISSCTCRLIRRVELLYAGCMSGMRKMINGLLKNKCNWP